MVLFWLDNPMALFEIDINSKTGQLNFVSLILIILIFVMYFIKKDIILYLILGIIIIAILYNCNIYNENFELNLDSQNSNPRRYTNSCVLSKPENPYNNLLPSDYNTELVYSSPCQDEQSKKNIEYVNNIPSDDILHTDLCLNRGLILPRDGTDQFMNWLYNSPNCKQNSIFMNTPNMKFDYSICQGQYGAQTPSNLGYF